MSNAPNIENGVRYKSMGDVFFHQFVTVLGSPMPTRFEGHLLSFPVLLNYLSSNIATIKVPVASMRPHLISPLYHPSYRYLYLAIANLPCVIPDT